MNNNPKSMDASYFHLEVTKMITHRFGLADAGEGFKLVAGAGESMKVIVEHRKQQGVR